VIILGPSLVSITLLFAPPPDDVPIEERLGEGPSTTSVEEPSTEPASEPAPAGGFGSVESVTTTSQVHAPPPPSQTEETEQGPRRELSALVEAGYGQTNLANTEGLDHHGLSARLHFVFYPWVSKKRRVAGGLGFTYGYLGLNRWKLPSGVELDKSSAQQQQLLLDVDLLVRPHPQWFSIQPSAAIGLGFYTNAELFAADRPALIPRNEYAFVSGGSLALCTAWDIACVVGGAEYLLDVRTVALDPLVDDARVINPWSWHLGLGFDILRVLERANRVPS
jgi:hypothetical protein